jgi:hypothetical protein
MHEFCEGSTTARSRSNKKRHIRLRWEVQNEAFDGAVKGSFVIAISVLVWLTCAPAMLADASYVVWSQKKCGWTASNPTDVIVAIATSRRGQDGGWATALSFGVLRPLKRPGSA